MIIMSCVICGKLVRVDEDSVSSFVSTQGGFRCTEICAPSGESPEELYKLKKEAHRRIKKYVQLNPTCKPTTCPYCEKEGQIEAHHKDYHKWNLVCWLCNSCHKKAHRDVLHKELIFVELPLLEALLTKGF